MRRQRGSGLRRGCPFDVQELFQFSGSVLQVAQNISESTTLLFHLGEMPANGSTGGKTLRGRNRLGKSANPQCFSLHFASASKQRLNLREDVQQFNV